MPTFDFHNIVSKAVSGVRLALANPITLTAAVAAFCTAGVLLYSNAWTYCDNLISAFSLPSLSMSSNPFVQLVSWTFNLDFLVNLFDTSFSISLKVFTTIVTFCSSLLAIVLVIRVYRIIVEICETLK